METITPALADAFLLLRQDLYAYLEEAEYLVDSLVEGADESVESACRLIPDLTTVIRGVLVEHTPDESTGQCPTCAQVWPCSSVRTIHALVKDPEREFINLVERVHERETNG